MNKPGTRSVEQLFATQGDAVQLKDLIAMLKSERVFRNFDGCYDAAADLTDLIEEVCDGGSQRREVDRTVTAAGVAPGQLDVVNLIRLGLEAAIEAHTVVEKQREHARAMVSTPDEVSDAVSYLTKRERAAWLRRLRTWLSTGIQHVRVYLLEDGTLDIATNGQSTHTIDRARALLEIQ